MPTTPPPSECSADLVDATALPKALDDAAEEKLTGLPFLATQRGQIISSDEVDPLADEESSPLPPQKRLLCLIVRQLTEEMLFATGVECEADARRRPLNHVRQIAMYVCHVAYSLPMGQVGQAFGRDRSTVRHACRTVEDRRDDPAYDRFVGIIERMAIAVNLLSGPQPE